MPAVIRGGAKAQSGGRGRAPAYAPAKLRGAGGFGLKPHAALAAAATVLGAGLLVMLATGGRAHALSAAVGQGVDGRMGVLGLRVEHLRLEGVSSFARGDVVQALAVPRGRPILGLDLARLREQVERVGWVKSARVERLLPDTLVVAVVERSRLAVWQHDGRTELVDDQGAVIPEADAGRFADLPLVVGEGANEAAATILPLVTARSSLMARTEALVRVDGRRWDIRLKDGGLIQLPATGEDAALIQLDQLDRRARVLELGFARIDLRDPQMIAVRPRDGAAPTGA